MEVTYANFNDVRHDDDTRVVSFERKTKGVMIPIGNEFVQLYIIRLKYIDGSYKDVRAYCDFGTSANLVDEKEKEIFFVSRLFGKDGLIVKEKRNDYIYLGGLTKDVNSKNRFSRYNPAGNGKTMQQSVDEMLSREIYPSLSYKYPDLGWDVLGMDFYFHSGKADMNDVFNNGLNSRYGGVGKDGLCSLTSTFYPADWTLNSLYDAARSYGDSVKKGNVFVLRIPSIYRGLSKGDGSIHPPMPTHKLIDYSTGDCVIIPELIYGMYDMDSGVFYKNPNYKPKYDPSGLVYDQETANVVVSKDIKNEWFDFMISRRNVPFDVLLKYDKKNRVFNKICDYYGIKQDIPNPPSWFRRK